MDPSLLSYFDDHARWESHSNDELARFLHGKLGTLLDAEVEIHGIDFTPGRAVEVRFQLTLEQAIGPMEYSADDLAWVLSDQFGYPAARARAVCEALVALGRAREGEPAAFRDAFLEAVPAAPLAAAQAADRWSEVAAEALTAEDLVPLLRSDRADVRQQAALASRHLEGSPPTPKGPDDPTPGRG